MKKQSDLLQTSGGHLISLSFCVDLEAATLQMKGRQDEGVTSQEQIPNDVVVN